MKRAAAVAVLGLLAALGGFRLVDAQAPEDCRMQCTLYLRETNGIVAGPRGAAVRLGLKRTTLVSKMQKLGITPDRAVSTPAQTGRAVHHC